MSLLLATSAKVKKTLAPPVPQPLVILHAEEDAVEVNVAAIPRTGHLFNRLLKAKERELVYQKVILEGCQRELASLKTKVEQENEPEEIAELLKMARHFAMALEGKKERFLTAYGEWKSAMLKLDQNLLREEAVRVSQQTRRKMKMASIAEC